MMNEIIRELKEMGIYAEETTKVDNGVTKVGLSLSWEENATVRPCFWEDGFVGDSPEEIAVDLAERLNNLDIPVIDANKITSKDFILDNVYIALQKTSEENIVKQPSEFEGIEEYLYIRIDDRGTCKMKPELMERAGVTLFEAWDSAYNNTCGITKIKTINGMMIVTNDREWEGASAILDKLNLRRWLDERDIELTKFFMLPSSIHECILLPYDEEMDLESMSAMVRDVNEHQVLPEEQLADRAYIVEVS